MAFFTDIHCCVYIHVLCSTLNVYRRYYDEVFLLLSLINSYSLFLFVVGRVVGFACLDNRLYVVYYERSTIDVFTADTFSEVSVITVDGLEDPVEIVACHDDHQLYVSDWAGSIWRVSAVSPTDYERWLTVDESFPGFSSLSRTSRRLVVTSPWSHRLRQYSTVNKQRRRVIQLSDSVKTVTHAVETSRDTFVVSHNAPHSAVSQLLCFILCLFVGFTSTVHCYCGNLSSNKLPLQIKCQLKTIFVFVN